MLPLILSQNLGKQELERTPEPVSVLRDADHVAEYDRVMETKLAVSYAIAVEVIYRARPVPFGGRGLDVACGPGHLSINMAKELKLDRATGVDLSAPMVEVARGNAARMGMDRVSFQTGDAASLTGFGDSEFELVTMMDAAHHLHSLEHVGQVLEEMDRVACPEGLLVVMDVVRLRSRKLTDTYVELLANDYAQRGLPNFLEDFRNSMFAAWTPAQLSGAVPARTKRQWSLVVPRGIPFAQFLIGYPRERKSVFLKRERLWKAESVPVTRRDRADYNLARVMMAGASVRPVPA